MPAVLRSQEAVLRTLKRLRAESGRQVEEISRSMFSKVVICFFDVATLMMRPHEEWFLKEADSFDVSGGIHTGGSMRSSGTRTLEFLMVM